MKLTKKIETEITQFLQKYWDTYFEGNLMQWQSFLTEDYKNIGTNQEEIWNSKREILDYTNKVLDQMVGNAVVRNKTVQIIPYNPYIMTHELGDLYIKNGKKWTFYAPIRLSSLIQKQDTGWIVLHQHGSFPDSKTQKGEAFAIDAIKAENIKLQKAVQKRTIELEQKNRELEVETALERIRAQAVAMKESSDLLDIVVTMRNEFIKLGHEAHYFWHMMWLPETYEKAMTSGDGSKIGFVMKLPRHIHGDIPQLAKWEKSKKPTVVHAMNVDDALDYVHKMVTLGDFQNIDPQAPTEDDIKHIGGLTFIMARTTHGEIGYSLPGVVKNPPKEDIDILVKFAGAFDLAHQRFLDLQKAEKQAKETQIELSLERIRSRVTAMQESNELFDVVVSMRNEFLSLGHEADYFWHMNWAKDNYEMSMTAEDGGRLGMVITVPKFVHEQMEDLHQWEKSNSPYFVLALNGKDAWDYIDKMNTYGKYKLVDPHAPSEEDILHIGGLTFIIARTTHGEIGFSLAGKVDNPPQASIEILVRFASVFDLAYKRFEDLKKAEAQTRETQIELALEKVRSRSMAMQHSDELSEAAEILYKEFYKLGVTPFSCGYLINNDTEKQWNVWMTDANDESFKSFWTLPYNADQHIKDRYENWQKKKPFHSTELKGDANIKHHKIIAKYAPWKKSSLKDLPDCLVLSNANFKYGHLLIVTGEALSEEIQSILIRFAKVFEQTYTRFLDLRKAELQTRETQIELALEKVRSRTMAMQHSDELQEASFLLDQQVRALGIKTWGCAFNIYGENESTEWFGNEAGVLHTYTVPREGIFKDYYDKGQKGETLVIQEFSGDDCVAHYEYMSSLPVIGDVLKTLKETNHGFPTYQIDHVVYFKYGYLLFITREHVPDSHAIFKRFAKVFEQTYTRFLDLQKAETQAREAQIEATLERVRSRSMAMHKSEEIGDVAFVLFEQLKSLGGELWGTGFGFCKTDSDVDEFWFANEKGIMPHLKIPNTKDSAHKKMYQGWEKNLELFSIEKGGKELKDHYKYMLTVPDVKPIFQGMLDEGIAFPTWQKWHAAYFKYGYMLVITTEPYPNETIFKRFAKVFEQAYIRFLDLQKAEAQAKEAQIESALERVRSRSMAMHQTKELQEVIHTVHQELLRLNIGIDGGSFIIVNDDIDEELFIWGSGGTTDTAMETKIPYTKNLIYTNLLQYIKNGNGLYTEEFTHEEKTKFFSFLLKQKPWSDLSKKEKSKTLNTSGGYSRSFYVSENTTLLVVNHEGKTFAPNENAILERFAKVFEQAYTRFLDLKKAEAQAREAQIEVAVERVRAEAMAMHTTTDFEKVTQQLLNQVQNLELDGFTGASIGLRDENDYFTWWDFSSPGNIGDPKSQLSTYNAHDYQLLGTELLDELKKGKNYMVFEYDLKRLNKAVREWGDINPAIAAEFKKAITEGNLTYQWNPCGRLANGLLAFDMVQPPDEDVKNIVIKMTHAFEQAYIRFQDLQKAEAQAREAQIETALEKVRSRTMAMQHSEELPEAANVLFTEVQNLGIPAWSCGYNILSEDKKSSTCIMSSEGEIQSPFILPLTKHISLKPWHKAILNNEQFFVYEQGDKDLEEHYDYMQSLPELQDTFKQLRDANIALPTFQVNHLAKFTNGFLLFITYERVPEAHDIFQRFAKVFEQTYTRFLDLKKAEAQAREAHIEAGLEKVRSRSLAMDSSNEMQDVANEIFYQMQALGLKMDAVGMSGEMDATKDYDVWIGGSTFKKPLTIPYSEATKVQRDYNIINANRDELFTSTYTGAIKKEYIDYLLAANSFPKKLQKIMVESDAFTTSISYSKSSGIQIVRYSEEPYTDEENQILIRFAKVFEQAYVRFRDIEIKEEQSRALLAEKKLLEKTLSNLQATQKQLIQSEKMASLGELTAGIAHEIQNPLNFVNNFSEVSKELLDEMLEEIENGDMEEVRAILADVIQNLDKINHHGKRADGIVKGMLQHSRASGNKKEPTDINALADEYLRLAYHGLRAKDKKFNAQLVTDFDDSIVTVDVIPQDLGRVILNLLTNAFYAVNEKKTSGLENYEPTVSISTKKKKNNIEIKVSDNGNGMPNSVKDKIFQPFFTTKPTGQGTGLGLSMSYDIITKGHDGELKVETKEDEGTTFIINLGIND